MIVRFDVPGTPVGKGRPKVSTMGGKFARMYTPAKTANYEGLIAYTAQQAMAGAGIAPFPGPVHVDMVIRLPIPSSWSKKKQLAAFEGRVMPTKKPDADNVIKAIFDGMNGVVWNDDVQAVSIFVRKIYDTRPGVGVAVNDIPAEAA